MSTSSVIDERLLDTRGAARFFGKAAGTLANERSRGTGPPFVRLSNGAIRYRPSDLQAFVEERRVEQGNGSHKARRIEVESIEQELERVHAMIHVCGSFEAAPSKLLAECATLWDRWTRAMARREDDDE